MKARVLALLLVFSALIVPGATAQEEGGFEAYSWIILLGLLVVLLLLGLILQMRKTRPAAKVKEEDLEEVEKDTAGSG